jgi:hypothetical protein
MEYGGDCNVKTLHSLPKLKMHLSQHTLDVLAGLYYDFGGANTNNFWAKVIPLPNGEFQVKFKLSESDIWHQVSTNDISFYLDFARHDRTPFPLDRLVYE